MSVNVINPRGLNARDWADFMTPNLEQYGNLPRLDSDDAWKEWAAQLGNLPGLSGEIVPNPYNFNEWQPWAERFCLNLSELP